MYHFHDRYAAQMAGAVEFFTRLTPQEQDFMREMARAIIAGASSSGRPR